MKVESHHDCSKMEGSWMVVMALEASNSLPTGVFTLRPLWPVPCNPQHLLLVEISMWL